MTKRYRLLARAQVDGEVREPGYVFTLKDGERGPHRTVVASMLAGWPGVIRRSLRLPTRGGPPAGSCLMSRRCATSRFTNP
jgi:hypothetical protein